MYFVLSIGFAIASCQPPYPHEVTVVLQQAGSHREELEKAILYYKRENPDSLKLKATYFLISHMSLHRTQGSDLKDIYDSALFNHLAHLPDSTIANLSFNHPLVNLLIDSLNTRYGSLSMLFLEEEADISTVSASYLINHIDHAFAAWKNRSWAKQYDFTQFCEYILPYRIANEPLEDWQSPMIKKFAWLSDSLGKNPSVEDVCLLINRHLQLTANVGFSQYPIAQPLSTMQKGRMGTCLEQVNLAIFAMRTQGLAVAYDFTPLYANYHSGHGWNALITPSGKSYSFMGTFRDFSQHYLWWKAAKVYRKMYSVQQEFPVSIVGKKSVPSLFKETTLKDVTKEYFPVSDIKVKLPSDKIKECKVAYICTFSDRQWYPIHWGRIDGDYTVTFNNMGRGHQITDTTIVPVADDLLYYTQINEGKGIVYTPMLYVDQQLQPVGPAMILFLDGSIKYLHPDTTHRQTLVLQRKYPETLRKRKWREHMVDGVFQGANQVDFSDAEDLFTILQPPNEHAVEIELTPKKKFRYVRFQMKNDTINSIAEFAFYGSNNRLLKGKLIHKGRFSLDGLLEGAVDGEPLTFAEGVSEMNYIGWDLLQPESVEKLTYLARNDGNAIQIGDRYELFFWDQEWISLGQVKADTTFLRYSNVPTNALFWLHNLDRGREERIFTYENSKQVWW